MSGKFPKPAVTWGHQYLLLTRAPDEWTGGVFGADGVNWAPAGPGKGLVWFNGTDWVRLDGTTTTIQVDGDASAAGNFNLIGGTGITLVQDGEDITINADGGGGSGTTRGYLEQAEPVALTASWTDLAAFPSPGTVNGDDEILVLEFFFEVQATDEDVYLKINFGAFSGASQLSVFWQAYPNGGSVVVGDLSGDSALTIVLGSRYFVKGTAWLKATHGSAQTLAPTLQASSVASASEIQIFAGWSRASIVTAV